MSREPQQSNPQGPAITAALVVGTLGAAVLLMLPGLLGVLAHEYGLVEAQLGFLSFADLGGLTVGAALGAALLSKVGIRRSARWGLVIAAVANSVSMTVSAYWPLLATRVVAGLGAGLIVAVCYVVLGRSKQVDRNFSVYLLCQGLFGAAALQALPHLPRAVSGTRVFALLAALYVAALLLTRYFSEGKYASRGEVKFARAGTASWTALGAVFAFFIAQGAIWAYLQLIGVNGGIDEPAVATGVALATLVGLSGPLAAAIVGARFGRALPLLVGLCTTLVAFAMLGSHLDAVRFAIAACLFVAAWNFTVPYQLSALAASDPEGSVVGWAASASLAGLAIGPPIAGMSVGVAGYASVLWLSGALCVVSLSAFVPALTMKVPGHPANG